MSPTGPSAAHTTEIALLAGATTARPVMIPGAFEPRVRRSPASPTMAAPYVPPVVPKRVVPHRTVLERMWRYVMRPTDTPLD
jgi:hypothetical protein